MGIMAVFSGRMLLSAPWQLTEPFQNFLMGGARGGYSQSNNPFSGGVGKPLTSAFDYGFNVVRQSQHDWLLPRAREAPDTPGQIKRQDGVKDRKLGLYPPASLNR